MIKQVYEEVITIDIDLFTIKLRPTLWYLQLWLNTSLYEFGL
jgi:hypothetical protein